MSARERAREHIKSFRKRRGVSEDAVDIESNINLRDLSMSLNILSDQLYGDFSHFIWELLQNADDSKYAANTKPRVDFILSDKYLTFQTNEIGFTKADVESLCGIGYSSKKGQNDTIGEKGIGFKSVFRIADVVDIHSGAYTFRLDTRPPLGNVGMVLPVWLDDGRNVAGTSVTLWLKAGVDFQALHTQIASFDFSFLLFSRKIGGVNLKVSTGHLVDKVGTLIDIDRGATIITKTNNSASTSLQHYVYFRHVLDDMPVRLPGSERPSGDSSTTIVLAFPHNNNKPILEPQKTYAFLPIGSFGFQFLIHADFVLTANRHDVDKDSAWNESLQQGISEAICLAFEWLATSPESEMRHTWPKYVDCLWSIRHPFMKSICDSSVAKLQSMELFQMELSRDTFRSADRSLIASADWRDDSGELVITVGTHAMQVISKAYTAGLSHVLFELGVKSFSISDFVNQLKEYISQKSTTFVRNTAEWHSRVAAILLEHLSSYGSLDYSEASYACRSLNIIPRNDGVWVSGDSIVDKPIFFHDNNRTSVPAGLDFGFVEPGASSNSYRRQLYTLLGVKSCHGTEICKMIVKSHEKTTLARTVNDLVSHAVYLFRANYVHEYGSRIPLLLADSKGIARFGGICVPFGERGSAIRALFADDFDGVNWLHPSYEKAVQPVEEVLWLKFLLEVDGVQTFPPLQLHGTLTGAMKHLMERNGSKKFLEHLKERNQSEYIWGRMTKTQAYTFRHEIRTLSVLTDQGDHELCETVLPSLTSATLGLLPIVQLDDPNDAGWTFLWEFGVLTALTPAFYVRQVQCLKATDENRQTKELAQKIYKALAAFNGLTTLDVSDFQREPLIYVEPRRWLYPKDCVWRASFNCTKYPVLSKIYRGCNVLFETHLRVRNAGLDDLISELSVMETKNLIERVKSLRHDILPALDTFLVKMTPSAAQKTALLAARIFPIKPENSNDLFAVKTTFCRAVDRFWIADMKWLKARFEGVLPLLDVTEDEKSSVDNIFQKLSMDQKRLSKSVQTEQIRHGGSQVLDSALTARLRRQSPYLIGIVSNSNNAPSGVEAAKTKLSNIQVFRVENITVRRFVMDNGSRKYGHDDQGEVLLSDTEAELHINVRQGLEIMDIVVPLTECIAEYFNLSDANRELVSKVLTTEKVDQFLEKLERAGVKIPTTTPVAGVADVGNVSVVDASDDATLAGDPNDDLAFALSNLQVSGQARLSTVPEHLPDRLSSPQGGPSTPSVHGSRPQNTSHTRSDASKRSRSRTPLSNRTDPFVVQPAEPATPIPGRATTPFSNRTDPVVVAPAQSQPQPESSEGLTTRFNNATLSDRTSSIIQQASRRAASAGIPGSSGGPAASFGSGVFTGFQFDLTISPSPSNDEVISVDGLTSITPSVIRHTRTDVSTLIESRPNLTPAREANLEFGLQAETTTVRHSSGQTASERRFRDISGGGNSFLQDSTTDSPQEIGFVGEHLFFKFLQEKFAPSFNYEHWTSRNRNKVSVIRFEGFEKDYADFTYTDVDGRFGQYLRGSHNVRGLEWVTEQGEKTYHLEVKTSLGGLDTAVRLSNNQISMSKKYARQFWTEETQNNVYVLVRVYGLLSNRSDPKVIMEFWYIQGYQNKEKLNKAASSGWQLTRVLAAKL